MKRKSKKTIRAIGAIITVLLIVVSSASPVFSMSAALTATDLFMSMWSAYSASLGISNSLNKNGLPANSNSPMSSADVSDIVNELYNKYVNAGSINQTLANWMETYSDAISLTSLGSTGLSTVINMSAGLVSWFDHFADWLFGTELDMTKGDNGYEYSNSELGSIVSINNIAVLPSYNGVYNASPYHARDPQRYVFYYYSKTEPIQAFTVANKYVILASAANTGVFSVHWNNGQLMYAEATTNTLDVDTGIYYYRDTYNSIADSTFPNYDTLADGLAEISSGNGNISLDLSVDAGDGVIEIPDVNSQDYAPTAISVPVNVPWDDTYAGTNALPLAVPEIMDKVSANELEIVDTANPDLTPPSSVMPPYLPFNIPSFNFNFSGIWHYVVAWVGSLGSGLSFFSSIWNNIPYAMVVPIYAAAVVVIVTSIFKRFV